MLRITWAAGAVVAALALSLAPTAPAHAAALQVGGLRIDDRADAPLGVDDTTPQLSWKLTGAGRAASQTAYQLRAAAGTAELDSGPYLWDSGKVASAASSAAYAGAPLRSRQPVAWQVRAWDANGETTGWSAPSTFELGLLDGDDWGAAKWIAHPAQSSVNQPVTVALGAQDARYVRLDVTKLGLPVSEGSLGMVSRLQLAELQLVDSSAGDANRAQGATVTASNPYEAGGWSRAALVDGVLTTPGYTSLESRTQAVSPSYWVQLDLGAVRHFDTLVLYPRTDLRTDDGRVPNFPTDYTVQASTADPAVRTTIKTVTDQPTPPGPDEASALPILARAFAAPKRVTRARLYVAGLGQYVATLNGKPVTDTVLNPGNTNPQRSVEAGTYDVTPLVRDGANTLGVELGNGITNVYTAINRAVGRTSVYQKFGSATPPSGALTAPAAAGATSVAVSSTSGYGAGDTINVDTAAAGVRLESRTVTAVGGGRVTFAPALERDHAAGAAVTGSGGPTDGAVAQPPKLIARLELTYADGTTDAIVSDPSWRAARGPTVTDNWYAGSDYDARREQPGWNEPGADLSAAATRRDGSPTGWEAAGLVPPPALRTKLTWREAPPVRVVDTLRPVAVTNPKPGVWVFNLGQNFAGFERLKLDGVVPAGTVVKLMPAELLKADGTVDPSSTGSSDGIYDTYTTAGGAGETWTPQFVYHGFQYVQVTGLPTGYTPTADTITGLQTRGAVDAAGTTTTSDAVVNATHRMSRYSIESNMQSIFTDCPHREKLGWLADTIQSMGAIHRNFDMSAYLRGVERNMAEAQLANGLVPDIAPEYPVFGGGFRDEPNWGDAMILVPQFLYTTYGDTRTMRQYFPQMRAYLDYLSSKASGGILRGDLGDWVAGDGSTPAEATGTYAYYSSAKAMADMARVLGRDAESAELAALARRIADAYNARFFNPVTHSYTTAGPAGTTGSQALDAFALEMGIVPSGEEQRVLDDLVARIDAYHPNGGGPHISGGTVSLQPIYRVLMRYERDDVLWATMQQPTAPSYRFFVESGRTTIPEFWDLQSSQNHMILLQIDEWFNAGLAGIRQADDSVGYDRIVIRPRIVGDLTHVAGSYETPHGTVRSEWTKDAAGVHLKVSVPANASAKVYVPAGADENLVGVGGDATPVGREPGYQVFDVGPGDVTFLRGTSVPGDVGGTVPPTLALTLGAPANFGAFSPGVDRTYSASTTASVVSTAGDAALSIADPSSVAPGRLVNGSFALSEPLRTPVGAVSGSPLVLKTWDGPISNDPVRVDLSQHISAKEPLRTGAYTKTLTFTLSTTAP